MAKKKQFAPHIYQEWGELFENLTPEQNSEILLGIAKFPEYEPNNVPVWNFIKSQLKKDYELFVEKCQSNSTIIKNYWEKRKQLNTNEYERITNDNECLPKRITNNELRITETNNSNIPTKEEIEQYCKTIGRKIDIDDFMAYYAATNWLDDNGFPIVWKRKVITFARNYKPKEEQEEKIDYENAPYNPYR